MPQAVSKSILISIKACQRTISEALKGFARATPQSLSQWSAENFYLSKESSYTEGNWEAIPWQVGIMDCISDDEIEIINWIKSARVGATKIMLASVGYHAEHKPRNQLFYQPTDDDAKEFVNTELNPMIRDVPAVQRVFPWFNTKNSKNTDKLKMFVSSKLLIKGGKSAGNYRRISSDIVYYDELEAFDKDVEGEGDPLTLGDKRVEGSFFKKSIRMTTPKLAETSLIEKSAERADYYFNYQVPCPHCGDYQVLQWSNMHWANNDPNTAKYQCQHCEKLLDNSELHDMLIEGFWLSRCGVEIVIGDTLKFVNAKGEELPKPQSVSFHIWTAYSPFVAWSVLVREYLKAKEEIKKKGDITEFKTFVNTTLGETWRDGDDNNALNEDALFARREHFKKTKNKLLANEKGLAIFGGFDTQNDRIEGEFRLYGLDGENWLQEYFVLYGDPSKKVLWDQLEKKVLQTFVNEHGEPMSLERATIDSGGSFTDEVYDFCKRFDNRLVIPSKGSSYYDKPLATLNAKRNEKGVKLAIIGTDTAKNIIYNWLQYSTKDPEQNQQDGDLSTESVNSFAGYCHFPIADFASREYFTQLCSEKKVLKKYQGKMRYVYDNNQKRNEPIDCFVGSLAALRLSEGYFGFDMDALANPATQDISFAEAAKRLNS